MFELSIIIPVYNVEKYLSACLNSLLRQNSCNFQTILVDDGSTDSSGIICDSYIGKIQNLLVFHKKNEGLSSARNFGISKSNSKFILFLDADDYLSDNFINYWESNLQKKDLDLYVFNIVEHNINNKIIRLPKGNIFLDLEFGKTEYLDNLLNDYRLVVSWNKIYKKRLFDSIKFEVGRIHEDEFIIHKLIDIIQTPIYMSSYYMYHYIRRANSITLAKKTVLKEFDILDALLDRALYLYQKNLVKSSYKTYAHLIYLFYAIKSRCQKDNKILIQSKKKEIFNIIKTSIGFFKFSLIKFDAIIKYNYKRYFK